MLRALHVSMCVHTCVVVVVSLATVHMLTLE